MAMGLVLRGGVLHHTSTAPCHCGGAEVRASKIKYAVELLSRGNVCSRTILPEANCECWMRFSVARVLVVLKQEVGISSSVGSSYVPEALCKVVCKDTPHLPKAGRKT